jgi:hypothetical protein
MILDQHGAPFPEKPIGQQYAEALRDTLWNLTLAIRAGYTHEEFRYWVETGEEP